MVCSYVVDANVFFFGLGMPILRGLQRGSWQKTSKHPNWNSLALARELVFHAGRAKGPGCIDGIMVQWLDVRMAHFLVL